MGLKTLKDLNEDFLQNKGYEIFCPKAFKILKQEAINWIKNCDCGSYPNTRCLSCKRFIEFFNIKEVDLK